MYRSAPFISGAPLSPTCFSSACEASGHQCSARIVEVTRAIEEAQEFGSVDADVNPVNSAVFFLLGLYALLITTHTWPEQHAMLDDYLRGSLRSIGAK